MARTKQQQPESNPSLSIKSITKSSVWDIQENDVFRMWEAATKDAEVKENIKHYSSWDKMEFEHIYPEMDSYLSGIYRFSSAPGSRAVAGLSLGAKQSANLAILYDSTFSSVGLFSPVAGRKQVPTSAYAHYWIAAGRSDFFYGKINGLRNKIQRKNIPYTMYSSVGGHTWRNWRVYLTEFYKTLF